MWWGVCNRTWQTHTGIRTCVLNVYWWRAHVYDAELIPRNITLPNLEKWGERESEKQRERTGGYCITSSICEHHHRCRCRWSNVRMCVSVCVFAWQNCCDQIDWLKIDTLIWISINPRKFTSAIAVQEEKMCAIFSKAKKHTSTLYRIVLIPSIYL